jgi:hypothetical protein
MPNPSLPSVRRSAFLLFFVVFLFAPTACSGGNATTWRIDHKAHTAYHPICTTCLIPFPTGANATGGSPTTTQTFSVAVKDKNAAELTQYYADILVADGWEWALNTDSSKYVAPKDAFFIATKNGHDYNVTIGPGAEGTAYSAFMELYPPECPFSYSDATVCGYGPSK